MQVPSLPQFEALEARVTRLEHQLTQALAQLPEWVKQKEACELTGRSRTWFFSERQAGRLPIAYQKTGARSLLYSRADCVALGHKNLILPPAHVAITQNSPASPSL